MQNFFYKLVTKKSEIKEGYVSAVSKEEAEKELTKNGSVIIYLSQKKPVLSLSSGNFSFLILAISISLFDG